MPAQRQLSELQERKRLLILQSDLHRLLLRAECSSVSARLSWLSEVKSQVRSASPWLGVGTAVVGMLATRRLRRLALWTSTAIAVWRWVRQGKAR